MFACQWHIDVPFGKQKEVLDIMKKWDEEMAKANDLPKPKSQRLMVGHIGTSPSHIINEYVVENISDWEAMLKAVATGRFHTYSDQLGPYIVPGSQHWVIWKVAG
jgi:hypothetical protein